jgi:AcrR family transcriptional regulator
MKSPRRIPVRAHPLRRNSDRTRRRLLDASIRLFSARGYHGVSVDQIVAAARVNKRMVYHYFGSKEAIYRAALLEVYNRIGRLEFHAVEGVGQPKEKLKHLLDSYFKFLHKNPEFTQLVQWGNVEGGRHIAKKQYVLSMYPLLERFKKIVEEGVRLGEFRRDLDLDHLMVQFIGSCFIYHSNRISLSQGLDLDLGNPSERARGLNLIHTLFFDGISTTPRGSRKIHPKAA